MTNIITKILEKRFAITNTRSMEYGQINTENVETGKLRGNLRMQTGKIATEKDAEERKEAVLSK